MSLDLKHSGARPLAVARRLALAHEPGLVLLDSSAASPSSFARWSILACRPSAIVRGRRGAFVEAVHGEPVVEPIDWLLERHQLRSEDSPLPFLGGLIGFLGFEFGWHLLDPHVQPEQPRTPELWVGDYPCALVYDHRDQRWWLVGDPDAAAGQVLREAVGAPATEPKPAVGRGGGMRTTVAPEAYRRAVDRCVEAIWDGELFEVNYTARFEAEWSGDGFSLYEAMRSGSTGEYGAFLDGDDFCIASVSPEQFMAVVGRRVLTRPIKGTRGRSDDPVEDVRLAEALVCSAKDRAENVMIVDLMRNDLTRVCELGSVDATDICGLHSFAGVHHLVSTVEGQLAQDVSPLEALLACFPAGSITGAPKLRAMELIASLEATPRGAYTGTMFYASCHGRLDSSVLIRTATLRDGLARYGAGGAVVAASDPASEYDEALVKAAGFRRAVHRGDAARE